MLIQRRFLLTTLSVFCIAFLQAQEKDSQKTVVELSKTKEEYLDSLKATFIKNDKIAKLDKKWIEELTNDELSEDMYSDIERLGDIQDVDYDLPVDLLKKRLQMLGEKSPFHIEYNPVLENTIKLMLKSRKKSIGRLMALSEYYFPLFEEKLAKYKIPMELKYLAIIESALNPRAVSRVGASGLWQFMLPTGKMYGLEVDSYVDERYDPIKSTEAACQYLTTLYGLYNDWELVLAAYNAGPGNVNKAIRRADGYRNYWNIRKYLPKETQGYVPAFLATTYIFEYHKEHNIVPKKAQFKRVETDTIYLKRKMTFEQIAEVTDVSVEELRFMNPSYKLDIIPYISEKPNYVRLPYDRIGLFVVNEDKIYAYVDYLSSKKEVALPVMESVANTTKTKTKANKEKFHTIRKGDTLSSIARQYGVTVSNLKKWNNIAGTNIQAGKKLRVM